MGLTALAFFGVFAITMILSLVRDPRFGLVGYLFVFYNHPPSRWWGGELPNLRWSLIAALVTLVSLALHTLTNGASRRT
jgi:hypothetical protein